MSLQTEARKRGCEIIELRDGIELFPPPNCRFTSGPHSLVAVRDVGEARPLTRVQMEADLLARLQADDWQLCRCELCEPKHKEARQ